MERKSPTRKPPTVGPVNTIEPETDSRAPDLESHLLGLQEQLDQLRTQVRQAQQLASLGTMAATLAHEVNNLLTPIRAYVQAALQADDAELQRKALTVTLKQVGLLIEMSGRVLEVGAAKPMERESVPVRAVVNDACTSLCRDLSKDSIRFAVDVEDSITVWADAHQLQQVFFNLFLNAREAMADEHGGRLAVSASGQDDRVVILVQNTGQPIPPAILPQIFEPFSTTKPSVRNGRQRCGGLGLALCRDLVEENDGTISVASNSEEGTTFTIELPAHS